jgi:hypothetical protein
VRRLLTAIVVSSIGTCVLYAVARFLAMPTGGKFLLLGSSWDFASGAAGAFVCAALFATPKAITFRSNIRPATLVVFGTFVAMCIGHACEQLYVRHVAVDFEFVGLLVWATFVTSWWLVPGASAVLTACNRVAAAVADQTF